VEDQEVGMAVLGADGDVVPDEVVVFEEAAEAGGEAALAGVALAVEESGLERKVATDAWCTKPLIQLAKCSTVLHGRKNHIPRTASALGPHRG